MFLTLKFSSCLWVSSPSQHLPSHVLLLLQHSSSFCFSKTIRINIIDDEEYEKNKNFFLEMGEPLLLEMSERKGGGITFLSFDPAHTRVNL